MIDFSRNHFELFGLPTRYRHRRARRSSAPIARCRATCIPTGTPAAATREKRHALQASARVNEAYRTLQDPVARARVPAARCAASTRTAETDTALAGRFPRRGSSSAARRPTKPLPSTTSAALGALRRRGARRRRRAASRRSSASLDDGGPARRRGCACANCGSWRSSPKISTRCTRVRARPMALFQISEPGEVAAAARAQARDRHRPRHDEFARRDGAQRPRRRAARRRRAAAACLRSSATAKTASRSATRAQARAGARSAATRSCRSSG